MATAYGTTDIRYRPTPGELSYKTSTTPDPSPPPPSGLIDSTSATGLPVAGYTAEQASATTPGSIGYDPTAYKTPADASVQDQVLKITGNDSPLMQQARMNAARTMNDRGLINSSTAIGEAEGAVIKSALPIAQQDASQNYTSMTKTADAMNAAAAFKAQSANTAENLGAQLKTSTAVSNANNVNTALKSFADAKNTTDLNTSLAQLQAETQKWTAQLGANTQISLGNLTADTQKQIATLNSNTTLATARLTADTQQALALLDAQNRQLLQTNINAAQMFNQISNNIAAIQQNPNLDEIAKKNAIQSQINMLHEGLLTTTKTSTTPQAGIGGLDLSKFFDSPNVFGGPTTNEGASSVGLNGSIPDGGTRDNYGNVFNADGTKAPWKGPSGQPVGPGGSSGGLQTGNPSGGGYSTYGDSNTPAGGQQLGEYVPPGGYRDNAGYVYDANGVRVGAGPVGRDSREW